MTLIFMEGFDSKEPTGRSGFTVASITPDFPVGKDGVGFAMSGSSGYGHIQIPWSDTISHWFWSANIHTTNFYNGDMRLVDTGNHAGLTISGGGQIQCIWPGGSLFSSQTVPLNTWNRIDLEVLWGQESDGLMRVWLNGSLVCEALGINTKYSWQGLPVNIRTTLGMYGSAKRSIDDVYLLSTDGPAPFNNRLGDVRVEGLRPAAPGSYTDLTPVGSPNNWDNVNETPSSTTDYNEADADGERDMYEMTSLAAGGNVLAVQSHYVARKTDTGNVFLVPSALDGSDWTHDTPIGLGTDFQHHSGSIHPLAPDGLPWSVAKLGNTEFGFSASIS